MPSTTDRGPAELLQLTARLLRSIAEGDWKTYTELCDPQLSAFEPESSGHLVEGMDFHRFYFDLPSAPNPSPKNNTIASPKVWMLGPDAGVVAYVRVVQRLNEAGQPVSVCSQETRVWQRREGQWKHVHFHRSAHA
jgi:calcium/calmodulin-dependent protein kinase (CaM kinase) II